MIRAMMGSWNARPAPRSTAPRRAIALAFALALASCGSTAPEGPAPASHPEVMAEITVLLERARLETQRRDLATADFLYTQAVERGREIEDAQQRIRIVMQLQARRLAFRGITGLEQGYTAAAAGLADRALALAGQPACAATSDAQPLAMFYLDLRDTLAAGGTFDGVSMSALDMAFRRCAIISGTPIESRGAAPTFGAFFRP